MTGGPRGHRRTARTLRAAVVPVLAAVTLGLGGCTGGSSAPMPSGVIGTPPTPGSIHETVPGASPGKPVEVGLQDEATVEGISVRVDSVTSQNVDNPIPAEGSGPSLVFAVTLRNGTTSPYRTNQLEVNLTAADGSSASRITGAPAVAFPATVGAGAQARATYVFLVAEGKRSHVSLEVSVAPGKPAVVFSGSAG